MNRRQLLKGVAVGGLLSGLGGISQARAQQKIMPWEWVEKQGEVTDTDGTPLQFMPKKPKDANPLEDELKKYPMCPYCGMNRTQFSHSRHLIHYADDLVDGTCSLHCAAISLSLNKDRGPKAIYAGDAGAEGEVKPLVEVSKASYVINPEKPGTMTKRSKFAYADSAKAKAAAGDKGHAVDFDTALVAAYVDMAEDTKMIRMRRAERRSKKQ